MKRAANSSRQRPSDRRSPATGIKLLLLVGGAVTFGSAIAGDSIQAVVVGMHSAASTRGFAAARGLPAGQPEGGRYAVVRLIEARHHGNTYALVYVPPQVNVRQNDLVEVAAGKADLVTDPGKGVVLGIAGELANNR